MAEPLDRLRVWACNDTPYPVVDPTLRPVIVEDNQCLRQLKNLTDRVQRGERRLRDPLAIAPTLLPPP